MFKPYISKSRLLKGGGCATASIDENHNPTGTNLVDRLVKINANIKEIDVASVANWLYEHNFTVAPERTTHPGEPITDIAMVTAIHGKDPARIEASYKAISRMVKANPKPAKIIIVEALEEDQPSNLDFVKNNPLVEIVTVTFYDKNKDLFQKEPLWSIGTRRAFEIEGVEKVVVIDSDCAFDDNSWAYLISEKLNKYELIHPFIGMNYSGQKDVGYGASHTILSEAYSLHNRYEGDRVTPGGSLACTKHFFQDILHNQWIGVVVGAGDVAFWMFMRGNKTESAKKPGAGEHDKFKDDGQCKNMPVHYANLILNHYYHGSIINRMYVTRTYLSRKFNGPDTIQLDKQNLYAWTDSLESKVFRDCYIALKEKTAAYLSVHRTFGLNYAKEMTRDIASKYYGTISDDNPLIIATVYRDGYDESPEVINKLYNNLVKYCKNKFKFIVFTDTKLNLVVDQYPINLNRIDSPSIWRRMCVFQNVFKPSDNVLFIDPSSEIKNEFTLLPCPSRRLLLAKRQTGEWDSAMMYFKNIPYIFSNYQTLLENKTTFSPEYVYFEPANYLVAMLYNKITIKNIRTHIDYMFKDEKEPYPASDIVLSTLR